jgi:hypothetical protein
MSYATDNKTSLSSIVIILFGLFVSAILPTPHSAHAAGGVTQPDNTTTPVLTGKTLDTPLFQATGQLVLSVDGRGASSDTYTIDVDKPSAQATVRRAFLLAVSRGNSEFVILDNQIALNGTPVSWNATVPTQIASTNHYADVTAIVQPVLDAAGVGRTAFTVDESVAGSNNVDGTVLAVIFDDPAQTQATTIILLFGTQNTNGDNFNISLANPIDPAGAQSVADMGLGISFSSQEPGATGIQFNTIDVNGTRLTSSAGGEDDGEAFTNGALITVGGLDDSNANPADPNLTPTPPLQPGDSRLDDELYSLLPLITDTTTTINVATANLSDDDNIFFAYFRLSGSAAINQSIVLSPATATQVVNTDHTVTALVSDNQGNPVAGVTVDFSVTAGPNSGTNGQAVTAADGTATFTYSSASVGTDTISASFNNGNTTITATPVTVTWITVAETITLAPPTATLVVGNTHSVTATVSDTLNAPAPGVTVDFSVTAGPNVGVTGQAVTAADGTATFSYPGTNGTGTDTISASFNNGAATITAIPVTVTWITQPATITLSPDGVTLTVGDNHTVSARVSDTLGVAAAGVIVDFIVTSGPNAGSGAQGTTDSNGLAQFSYPGSGGIGTDTIAASLVSGVTTISAAPVTVIWITPPAAAIPTLAPLGLILLLLLLVTTGVQALRRR